MYRLFLAVAVTILLPLLPARAECLKEQLVGTWELVSIDLDRDGTKIALFGEAPRGTQVMTADGHFATVITRASLPLYAGANRLLGTSEEYAAIAQGSEALFGTWVVDETNSIVTFTVQASTFPNWEGERQRRSFSLESDTWRYLAPVTTMGPGSADVVWKRKAPPADPLDFNYGWGHASIP